MEGNGHLPEEFEAFENPTGEVLGADIRRPVARSLNRTLKRLRGKSPHTVVLLGEDVGEVYTDDIRGARDSEEDGKLKLYIWQAGEHKKAVAVVIAAGVVIGGISALKHKKR